MTIDIKFEGYRIVPYLNGQELTMNVSPFLLFLASAGMCSAVFVQAFISRRGISTDGVIITQKMDYNPVTNHVGKIDIHIQLPEGFPEKYEGAIVNVVNQCPVKQHLIDPPTFNVIPHLSTNEATS